MFKPTTYEARREALRKALAARGVAEGLVLLIGNLDSPKNYHDNTYPFRQDSGFLYYVGIAQAGLAATIDLASGDATLFGDDGTIDDIIWTGPLPGMAELAAASGIRKVRRRSEFASAASGAKPLFLPPYRAESRVELAAILGLGYAEVDAAASLPLIRATVELRERKSDEEVGQMELAVGLTVEMHRAAIGTARPGMRESDIMARAAQVALAAHGTSFPIIATTRGSIFHIRTHERILEAGGLFLLDAGAESPEGYAGDLTSTFPIGPKFDSRQRAVYELVLKAQAAACSILGPGRPFREAHFAAARAIASGLKELGLMKGDVDEAVAAGAHALFFPHGVGHQIGLDVHDMENYGEVWVGYDGEAKSQQFGLRSLRLAKPLLPGMVHSVEPGIYFIPELVALWKSERRFEDFIAYDRLEPWMPVGGIRNEEDWLVTETGARRLGPAFDKSPGAIEAYRA